MAPLTTGVIQAILREFSQQRAGRGRYVSGGGGGITATGGVISDYTDPGPGLVYRAHVFSSSGTFSVTAGSDNVEYLVVAGGGGGGAYIGGGGGAGGYRTASGFRVSTSPGAYTVTVGGGGAGGVTATTAGVNGVDSSFGATITSTGGGRGSYFAPGWTTGAAGGSGGGGGLGALAGGSGTNYPGPTQQGFPG